MESELEFDTAGAGASTDTEVVVEEEDDTCGSKPGCAACATIAGATEDAGCADSAANEADIGRFPGSAPFALIEC